MTETRDALIANLPALLQAVLAATAQQPALLCRENLPADAVIEFAQNADDRNPVHHWQQGVNHVIVPGAFFPARVAGAFINALIEDDSSHEGAVVGFDRVRFRRPGVVPFVGGLDYEIYAWSKHCKLKGDFLWAHVEWGIFFLDGEREAELRQRASVTGSSLFKFK